MNIDRIDRAILAELSRDSRLSSRGLAERLHISRSAAHTRVTRLVSEGAIERFTTTVNRRQVGLRVSALVILTIDDRPWQEVAAALLALPFVENVRAVSGDIDFVVLVSAPSNDELSAMIMSQIHVIPGVLSTRSHVVLNDREGTPPAEALDSWHD